MGESPNVKWFTIGACRQTLFVIGHTASTEACVQALAMLGDKFLNNAFQDVIPLFLLVFLFFLHQSQLLLLSDFFKVMPTMLMLLATGLKALHTEVIIFAFLAIVTGIHWTLMADITLIVRKYKVFLLL